jgi:hypothetical protein
MSASAHIQKFSQTSEGHTEYFIKVVFNGREWAIRKRYSEFTQFDDYLQKSGYRVNYSLPSKTWWKRFDQNVLSQRQKELQTYLDILLKSTVSTENSLVREFLEVDVNKLAYARRQTFKEFKFSENLDIFVAQFQKAVINIPSNKLTIGTPIPSRNRQLSVFKRINSLGTGYGSTVPKSKSSSFSNRPMLRRGETVTSDGGSVSGTATPPATPNTRDRRFSIDIFSQMASASYRESGLSVSLEDNGFITAVDALWTHYSMPVELAIEEVESQGDCPIPALETYSDTLNTDILSVLRSGPLTHISGRPDNGMRRLELEMDNIVSDLPSFINVVLESNNPVFLRLPIISHDSGSSSGDRSIGGTDKSDSMSESVASKQSICSMRGSANQTIEEEDEEDGESVRNESLELLGERFLSPATSLESLAR